MEKIFLFFPVGFALGFAFVELTYKLIGKGLSLFYLLSLPIKLFLWAFLLYILFVLGGLWGFFGAMGGFLFGFFSVIVLRGFKRNGGPEGT
ncbi:MAG: hypothetical protein ACK4OF_02885 [Aquificaceae bacterium]